MSAPQHADRACDVPAGSCSKLIATPTPSRYIGAAQRSIAGPHLALERS